MPSIDGDITMTEAFTRDQDLKNIEQDIIKMEKQESARRGSVATPVKSEAFLKSKVTPATKDRPMASIEADDNYNPVTPSKSSVRAGRGRGKKRVRSQSPKTTAGTKVAADKVAKTRQIPKKKDTKKGLKNIQGELLGEVLAEGGDNGDEWEDEFDGVRSDENTWGQVDKVIGSTGKPTHPNGRAEGRKLVAWHRARMMEKLILHIVFECRRAGINLPWDKIAHRLCPASSGAAAQQYINKMRDVLITEGHLVPPPLGKKAVFDPSIRGYIRDMDAEDPKTSRPVGWLEEIVDLKESLVIPGVSRGSGTYRRDKTRWQGNRSTIGEETPTKTNKKLPKPKSEPKEKAVKIKKERSESLDPAEMPSDEDYDPRNRLKIKGYRKRKVKAKTKRRNEMDEDMDKITESENESLGYSGSETYLKDTPSKKKVSDNNDATPLAFPVKLKLSPIALSQFPAGVAGNSAQYASAGDNTEDNGDSEGVYDDAETAIDDSANDGDDVFGPDSLSLDNNRDLELRAHGLFPSNDYVGGMGHGYDFYNPRVSMNAPEYNPLYASAYNSNNFAEPAFFQNNDGANSFGLFSMPNFNPASGMYDGLNFNGQNDTAQDMNGGHNSTRSFSLSTAVSSSNSSFAHGSTNADYDGGAVDYANASIVPDHGFESPDGSWVQDYAANASFKQLHDL